MIRLAQHVPAFVDGVEPKTAMAKTIEDLLRVPWVAAYSRPDVWQLGGVIAFHRWSIADPDSPQPMLMAEHAGGDHWRVVGYLEADEPVDLPTWDMSPDGRARVERWNRDDG